MPIYRAILILLLAFSSLLNAIAAHEQEKFSRAEQHIKWGAIGGINLSKVDGDGHHGYHALGGTAGLWGIYAFSRSNWNLRLELRYAGKGSRYTEKIQGNETREFTSYSFTLHYIELPICVEYVFLERFSVGIGLECGYLISWKERNAFGALDKSFRLAPKRYEIAAIAALEWRFLPRWAARGGFSYSVLPIRGTPDDILGKCHGQYNNTLHLILQFEF